MIKKVTKIIEDEANLALENGQTPVIILDLDDTVFDTRARTLKILKEFAMSNNIGPTQTNFINAIKLENIKYYVADTLRDHGIGDEDLIERIKQYWLARFFSNAYIEKDPVTAGVMQFNDFLKSTGICCYYITGRSNKLRSGTLQALKTHGLHLPDEKLLITKENPAIADREYKQIISEQFNSNSKLKVIAHFENQPDNLYVMMDFFPDALGCLRKTIHAPTTMQPRDEVIYFNEFTEFFA